MQSTDTKNHNADVTSNCETDRKNYKKNWGSNRRAIKKQKDDSETPKNKNMAFFETIIYNLKLNYSKVSELTGISQQLISYWIMTDDVKLSNLLELFNKLGITLECTFIPLPGSIYVTQSETYTIEFGELPTFSQTLNNDKNPVIASMLMKNGRLKFLAELIRNVGPGLVNFCKITGYQYFTVYQWLMKDDIKIARLYEIAEKTQQTISWKIHKKTD